jgi:hypothetical protein
MSNLRDWSGDVKPDRFYVLRFCFGGGRDILVCLMSDARRFPAAMVDLVKLRGHLSEFLTAFGYMNPVLRAVAIDVHFRIEPTRVVKSASFDEPEFRHQGDVRENRRPALRTEVSVNRLTTSPVS